MTATQKAKCLAIAQAAADRVVLYRPTYPLPMRCARIEAFVFVGVYQERYASSR